MFDHEGKWTAGAATTLQALWSIRDSILTTKQKVVLYSLTLRAKPTLDGMTCYPSLATIAKDTGLSRRCVVDVVNELLTIDVVGHGWHILTRDSGGPERSNIYTVDLDAIVALPPHTLPTPKRRARSDSPSRRT